MQGWQARRVSVRLSARVHIEPAIVKASIDAKIAVSSRSPSVIGMDLVDAIVEGAERGSVLHQDQIYWIADLQPPTPPPSLATTGSAESFSQARRINIHSGSPSHELSLVWQYISLNGTSCYALYLSRYSGQPVDNPQYTVRSCTLKLLLSEIEQMRPRYQLNAIGFPAN